MEFQTTIQNYNPKSSVECEICSIFQHKVERIPHFTQVTEIVHMQLYEVQKSNSSYPARFKTKIGKTQMFILYLFKDSETQQFIQGKQTIQ